MKTLSPSLISDSQRLVSARSRFGHAIPVYDDGFGPLWIHRDSLGISGIVRAQTWEDAYGICEDEFFPEESMTIEEIAKEYGFKREHVKIVRDPLAQAGKHTAAGERICRDTDYVNGRLPDGLFVRWLTIETPDADAWPDNELFQEACGFRPSGPNSRDTLNHGIYAKDLNGGYLDRLTSTLLSELEITLEIVEE